MLETVFTNIPTLVTNFESLKTLLDTPWGQTHRKDIFHTLREKLPTIIGSSEQLVDILKDANDSEKEVVFAALSRKLHWFNQTGWRTQDDLYRVLSVMNGAQQEGLMELLKTRFYEIARGGSFALIDSPLSEGLAKITQLISDTHARDSVSTASKEDLDSLPSSVSISDRDSDASSTPTDSISTGDASISAGMDEKPNALAAFLETPLGQKNQKIILIALRELFPQLIASSTDFRSIMQRTNPQGQTLILSALAETLRTFNTPGFETPKDLSIVLDAMNKKQQGVFIANLEDRFFPLAQRNFDEVGSAIARAETAEEDIARTSPP